MAHVNWSCLGGPGDRSKAAHALESARGRIQTVSLPPFTGYGAATTGYHIDAGQLGADIDLGNRQGRLEGRIDLRLSHLALSPAEPDVIEQLTARLSMPLPTALAVLADDDGMVRIELPVSGNLDAPDFGLGPLIDKVAGIALRKAVTTYLGTMLEPYSTIFTVASTAVEMLSAIRLEPMPFPPGEAAVTPTIADYGKRLARLLAERPALSLHLCGRATPRDALALTEGRQTGEGKAPAAADPEARLRALARARAEAVRQHLVEGYGIAPGRLLVCRPVIDEDEAALPRVELSL